jgi:hypothetical protein
MIALRVATAFALVATSAAADARRGLNDSGNCVDNCRLAAGEPCPPCQPFWSGGDGPEVLARYRTDIDQYEAELQAYAARNPSYRRSETHQAAKTATLNLKSLADAMAAVNRIERR